jgi:Spy/CpxP family protein refolding chaperone
MGNGSPEGLISRSDVQKDLQLTDDQKTQIAKIQEDARTAGEARMQGVDFQSLSDADRQKLRDEGRKANDETNLKIDAVLTPVQQIRLLGIFVQLNGNSAILNKTVADKLFLTADQKTKIKNLQTEQQANIADIQQKIRSGEIDRSQRGALMQKNRDVMNTALGNVLSEAQKAELRKLAGPTFTPDPSISNDYGGPRGGGRRGGGGGAPGAG